MQLMFNQLLSKLKRLSMLLKDRPLLNTVRIALFGMLNRIYIKYKICLFMTHLVIQIIYNKYLKLCFL